MTIESAKHRPRLKRAIAVTSRWLHVYLSMISFVLVLFFAATGLTLNHPDWFSHTRTTEHFGIADKIMLRSQNADGADKLGLTEMLRNREHIHGSVSDFRVEDEQITISFRAPGYTADAFIDRDTGKYDVTETSNGFFAVINDLHKGRDAGKAWGLIIDVSAILLVLVSFTGLVLVWFVYRRRSAGLLLAAGTAIITWGVFHFLVP